MISSQTVLPLLAPLPASIPTKVSECSKQILCCYTNSTNHIQVIRSENVSSWCFERVVFPGQRLLFEALLSARVEIYTGTIATALLSDKIAVSQLKVKPQ